MKLSYYPGCSLTGTAKEYDESVREVAGLLDIELVELEDWNCCGASSAHMTNHKLSVELAARNLLISEKSKLDLLVPCSACYQRLRAADNALREDPVAFDVGNYDPSFEIIHISNLLSRSDILSRIIEKLKTPLKGLSLACYYGCLSLRPPTVTGAESFEQPTHLEGICAALGASSVSWSHRTECCSGSLTMARPEITGKLVGDIIDAAIHAGAQAITTDCPMCHSNLESRQNIGGGKSMPIFFITELIAHALSEKPNLKKFKAHLVDPLPMLTKLENEAGN